MFRPVFCARLSRRTTTEIALAELAVGSLIPTSGASGLAFGAWILHREGMPDEQIARRSVAFLEIKSAVNFVAVAVIGTLMALGRRAAPAAAADRAPGRAVGRVPGRGGRALPPGARRGPGKGASKLRRAMHAARSAVGTGTAEAIELLRRPDWRLAVGAIGYWAFDNAVLWATFKAFGADVPLTVLAMGYLIGQLGGALPLPGGIGGIDGGLVGALVVYGAKAADAGGGRARLPHHPVLAAADRGRDRVRAAAARARARRPRGAQLRALSVPVLT